MTPKHPESLLRTATGLIDRWLAYQVYARELPGLAVGIDLGGSAFFRHYYGFADLAGRRPTGPETVYRIASHSKLFTSTAVMLLRAAGKLNLDDTVAAHLPQSGSPELAQITLRQLLTHSSGVNRDGDTYHWTYDEPFPDRDSLLRQIAAGIAVFPPEKVWKYTNLGMALLGLVVEAVSGMPYGMAVTDLVLRPLGLRSTLPEYSPNLRARLATGYSRALPGERRQPFKQIDTRAMGSAAGFCSTVDDLLAFYEAHRMGNATLLSDADKALMQQVHFRNGGVAWGLGFAMRTIGNLEYAGHGGRLPGFLTFSGLNQKYQLAIAVMTNAIDGQARDLFAGISHLLYLALETPEVFQAGEFEDPDDHRAIAGIYRSLFGLELFGPLGGKLVGLNPDLLDPAGELDIFDQTGPMAFRIPGRDPVGPVGESLMFEKDDDGRVALARKPGRPSHRFEIP